MSVEQVRQIRCPECGSTHVVKAGWKLTRKGRKQQYQCKQCARIFTLPEGK